MLTFLCYVLVWTTARCATYNKEARATHRRPHVQQGSAGHTQAGRQQGAGHTQAGRSANVQQGGTGHTQAGRSARPTYNKEARATHRLGRTAQAHNVRCEGTRNARTRRSVVRHTMRGITLGARTRGGRTNGITLDGRTYDAGRTESLCTDARTRDRDMEARRARGGMLDERNHFGRTHVRGKHDVHVGNRQYAVHHHSIRMPPVGGRAQDSGAHPLGMSRARRDNRHYAVRRMHRAKL